MIILNRIAIKKPTQKLPLSNLLHVIADKNVMSTAPIPKVTEKASSVLRKTLPKVATIVQIAMNITHIVQYLAHQSLFFFLEKHSVFFLSKSDL